MKNSYCVAKNVTFLVRLLFLKTDDLKCDDGKIVFSKREMTSSFFRQQQADGKNRIAFLES